MNTKRGSSEAEWTREGIDKEGDVIDHRLLIGCGQRRRKQVSGLSTVNRA
jgi:hypothetical protein